MKRFLRENWLYVVVPIVLVVAGLGALFLFGGNESSPFIYPIF